MTLPDGYRSRPASLADRGAIAALMAALDQEALGFVDYSEDDLIEEWSRPRFDVSRHALVIEGPQGSLAGYAYTWERAPGEVVTAEIWPHPEHRDPTIGDRLRAFAEARAREVAVEHGREIALQIPLYSTEEDAAERLRSAGYRTVRFFWRMGKLLGPDEPESEARPGVRIRGFDRERDGHAAYETLVASFAEHWGNSDPPYEEWLAHEAGGDGFDARLWFVAEADDGVVGVITGQETDGRGWIGQLGVLAEYRGRGVGAALLRASFAAFARRGFAEALLSVDSENVTGASRVYERVGMRAKFRFDFWEKRIGPG